MWIGYVNIHLNNNKSTESWGVRSPPPPPPNAQNMVYRVRSVHVVFIISATDLQLGILINDLFSIHVTYNDKHN